MRTSSQTDNTKTRQPWIERPGRSQLPLGLRDRVFTEGASASSRELGGSVGVGSEGGSEVLSVGSVGGAPWTHARKPAPCSSSAARLPSLPPLTARLVSCGEARHVHTLGRGRW